MPRPPDSQTQATWHSNTRHISPSELSILPALAEWCARQEDCSGRQGPCKGHRTEGLPLQSGQEGLQGPRGGGRNATAQGCPTLQSGSGPWEADLVM